MKLTEELKKKLQNALYMKEGATIECPICHGIDWSVNTNIFEYQDFQYAQNRSPEPEKVFPVIILVCEKCNYCISFSAANLGLVLPKRNDNCRAKVKTKYDWRFLERKSFLKWLNNGTRREKLILLLTYFVIFIGGVEAGPNITYSVIINTILMIVTSKSIGWLFNFLGVLLLGLSAYLIDAGSKNPLIDVTKHGSFSITTSTKGTKMLQHNKKLHKLGMGALILGIILSAVGLILTFPNDINWMGGIY